MKRGAIITDAAFAAGLDRLFVQSGRPNRMAVALSGGADSLALVLLARDYAKAQGVGLVALTVDHGLRPESASEARQVAKWMKSAGVRHTVLQWQGQKPRANIQAAARTARYALLEDWCRAHRCRHLLLAHHRDDQAETVLLRLGRGSGVEGLAAMQSVLCVGGIWRLRPLLDWSKPALESYLTARRQDWVRDPSNEDSKYARARVRQAMALLLPEGVTSARLAATADRMARASAALQHHADDRLAQASAWDDLFGFAQIDAARLLSAPEETALRALRLALQRMSGADHPPREEDIQRLANFLARPGFRGASLHGCILKPWRGHVILAPEAAQLPPPRAVKPGEAFDWMGQSLHAPNKTGLILGPLTAEAWQEWSRAHPDAAKNLSDRLPAFVRPTVPAFYRRGRLVFCPALDQSLESLGKIKPGKV